MDVEKLKGRLYEKVVKSDTCWNWTGPDNGLGYGRISLGVRGEGVKYTHIVSFFLEHERWPAPKMCVLHKCDNPRCVRPDHLFEGTKKDNSMDMAAKGRCGFQTMPERTCKYQVGEANTNRKITEKTVLKIRQLHRDGMLQKDIAKAFSLSRGNVCLIVNRKAWTHI